LVGLNGKIMRTLLQTNSLPRLLAIALMLASVHAFAQKQDTTSLYRIETRDGNEYIGKIVEQNNDQIILKTEKLGVLAIRVIEVVKLDPIKASQVKRDEYWLDNLQSTRYLWSPNAYGLKRGEGYYQNIWILFNQFSVGVTDHFSLGGGMIPLFLFAGAPTPAWFTPKVSIPVKNNRLNLGIGGLFGGVIGVENTGFGILYGTITLGSRDQNVSLGLGNGYTGEGGWANNPAFSFSGLLRTGPRGYLITENYYIRGNVSDLILFSIGGRRIIKNTGLDFGLVIPSDTGGSLFAVPWLGFTVPFGKKARL
jgi:hypothetical protein